MRETLDFSGRCLGVGTRFELLAELTRREKDAGIKPDPEIDAFMKATAMSGLETNLGTDYVLKVCIHQFYFQLQCNILRPCPKFQCLMDLTYCDRFLDWISVLILWWVMR